MLGLQKKRNNVIIERQTMEFLDPKKRRQHHVYLMISYVLMPVAIILATAILLMIAYGFGIGRDGQVRQNGLVFAGSSPSGATIYVTKPDGQPERKSAKTNAKLSLEAGRYTLSFEKEGYTNWQRSIAVNGGIVDRYDYALMVPKELQTETVKSYETAVEFASQSRDRRWLVVQHAAAKNEFTLFDLNDLNQAPKLLDVPAGILTEPSRTQSWEQVEWSTNNRHALFKRTYTADGQSRQEFILFDREQPGESINVSTTLNTTASDIQLIDGKYDKFYMLNTEDNSLSQATIKEPALENLLSDVLAYESYSDNKILYAESLKDASDKVSVRIKDGDRTFTLTQLPKNDTYLLDLAQHDNDWYIAVGAASEDKIYVYKNPIEVLKRDAGGLLVPVQVLKVEDPVFLSFSSNTQFIMATNGSKNGFYVYDIDYDKAYKYTSNMSLDAPQKHARWMDGHRITYISDGKLVWFDYDYTNKRTLDNADNNFMPFFERDYRYVFTIAKQQADGQTSWQLRNTPLRLEADL